MKKCCWWRLECAVSQQDELGSPLRVLYGNGNGDIYGYDEFGEELYEAPDPEKEASDRYSRQGEGQPFGYTGYRYDAVGGTYFAQAREYQTILGRFIAEDKMPGDGMFSKTLNRYGYCWGNPVGLVDLNGKEPVNAFLPTIPSPLELPILYKEENDQKSYEEQLRDDLKGAVKGYANWGQYLKTFPFNDTQEAMETVLKYDCEITAAAKKYDIDKEMVQAVLFQEVRFYGIDDPVADSLVVQSYAYEKQMVEYIEWLNATNGRITFPIKQAPAAVIGYRTDSSTGLGQIFAKTAIEATNWYNGKIIYDYNKLESRREVWYALQDDSYNVDMIAMVLAYKRSIIDDNSSVQSIMKAYNGSNEWAEKYGKVALEYYEAFRKYNESILGNCSTD